VLLEDELDKRVVFWPPAAFTDDEEVVVVWNDREEEAPSIPSRDMGS
jgi:hypothetical protein